MKIPIDKIEPNPQQPRAIFNQEELQELADSIKATGLLQPILVEDHGDKYILVAGERRTRAHKLLGLKEIEANVIAPTNHNGRELLINAIVENVQRKDINPIEEARAYQRLKTTHKMTIRAVAQMVGKHETQIRNILLLLDYDKEIQDLIEADRFPKADGLARAIQSIPDRSSRIELATAISYKSIKIPTAIKAAERITKVLNAKRSLKHHRSPAVELARENNFLDALDDDRAPNNWGIIQQTGELPKWPLVIRSAIKTCEDCPLKDVASAESCAECPLADFLISLVEVTNGSR